MSNNQGYIYVRDHESYEKYRACKLGKTTGIVERDGTYATNEILRGKFTDVYEVSSRELAYIERLLQICFTDYHIYYDGGTEFYGIEIIDQIEPKLIEYNINYRKLSSDEVDEINRKIRECKKAEDELQKIDSIEELLSHAKSRNISIVNDKIADNNFVEEKFNDLQISESDYLTVNNNYKPKDFQIPIIDEAVKYFETNDKGLLIMPCGTGKTITSLFIAATMQIRTIMIFVSSITLVDQWTVVAENIFCNAQVIGLKSKVSCDLHEFLTDNKRCVIIAHYGRSYDINESLEGTNFQFDLKILDEAHHATTENKEENKEGKTFIKSLNTPSKKQLAMTATLKTVKEPDSYDSYDSYLAIGNTSIENFGEIIFREPLAWGIKLKAVCDYRIKTITIKKDEIEAELQDVEYENSLSNIFLAAYTALKSIETDEKYHILVYFNKIENANSAEKCIKQINDKYFNKEIFCSAYDSSKSMKEQKNIMDKFLQSDIGILTCVYGLGEGWDCPILNCVVFGEKMISEIRTVQSALRPCRLDKNNPNKIATIIIPIFDVDDLLEDTTNTEFEKVANVIYHMGLEDCHIEKKFTASRISLASKIVRKTTEKKENDISMPSDDQDLTKRLILRSVDKNHRKIVYSYDKAKTKLKDKNLTNSTYAEFCETNIHFPKVPETYYGAQFRGWPDYLGIDTSKFYTKEECIKEFKSGRYGYLIKQIDKPSERATKLNEVNSKFPTYELWEMIYKDTIENMIEIKPKKLNPSPYASRNKA